MSGESGGSVGAIVSVIRDKSAKPIKRIQALGEFLEHQRDELFSSLPRHVTVDRMQALVMKTFRLQPKLLDCSMASIVSAIIDASSVGLEIDGVLGQAYLIPYKDEAKLVPGYRGLLDLARRHGNVKVSTRLVFPEDEFHFEFGDDERIVHKPNLKAAAKYKDEDAVYVYLIAKVGDEVVCRSVWSTEQVNAHKERYSPSYRKASSPWNTAWGSMARKTLIRHVIARGEVPVSSVVQRLAVREELIEARMAFDALPHKAKTIGDIAPDDDPRDAMSDDDMGDFIDSVDIDDEEEAPRVGEPPEDIIQGQQEEPVDPSPAKVDDGSSAINPKKGETPRAFIERLVGRCRRGDVDKQTALAICKKQGREGFLGRDDVIVASEMLQKLA